MNLHSRSLSFFIYLSFYLLTSLGIANAAPMIVSPVPFSDLSGPTVEFQWDNVDNIEQEPTVVTEYWLHVGSPYDGDDGPPADTDAYFDSKSLGLATSAVATELPSDTLVLVTLWYKEAGVQKWQIAPQLQYYVSPITVEEPSIVDLDPGDVFNFWYEDEETGEMINDWFIEFSGNGTPVTDWWVNMGSQPRNTYYLSTGRLGPAAEVVYSPLLDLGEDEDEDIYLIGFDILRNQNPYPVSVYTTLWYEVDRRWSFVEQMNHATGSLYRDAYRSVLLDEAVDTEEADGTGVIVGESHTFILADYAITNGSAEALEAQPVIKWKLEIGSAVGGTQFYSGPAVDATFNEYTSIDADGLLANDETIFVRVWYQLRNTTPGYPAYSALGWFHQDFEFINSLGLPEPPQ